MRESERMRENENVRMCGGWATFKVSSTVIDRGGGGGDDLLRHYLHM